MCHTAFVNTWAFKNTASFPQLHAAGSWVFPHSCSILWLSQMLKQLCKSTAVGTKSVLQKATSHFVLHAIYCLNSWENLSVRLNGLQPCEFRGPLEQLSVRAERAALAEELVVRTQCQPCAPAQPSQRSGAVSEEPQGPPRSARSRQHGQPRLGPVCSPRLAARPQSSFHQASFYHPRILKRLLNHLLLKSKIQQAWCCTYLTIKTIKHCLLVLIVSVHDIQY